MYARPRTRDQDFERLIRNSYGLPPATRRRTRTGRSVTMTADTGAEVIPQPGAGTGPGTEDSPEYVVDREPVTPIAAPAAPDPPAPPSPLSPVEPVTPPVQPPVLEPSPAPQQPEPIGPAVTPPPAEPMPVAPTDRPAEPTPVLPPPVVPAAAPAAATAPPPSTSAPASAHLSGDDLAADMQAILTGSKVYDPTTGTTRPRDDVGTPPAAPDPGRPMPDSPNQQAIFDRIAMSMEHSNRFDLGSVDLQRRFDQFDRRDDSRRAPARTDPVSTSQSVAAPTADQSAAFWQSLPPGALSGVPLVGGCVTGIAAMAPPLEHSEPMYDTGEHVLAGGDLYPDQLPVNGVRFSYGQVIAMGDLYDQVGDLRSAPAAELNALKALIVEDTNHYSGRGGGGVSNQRWQDATADRYLALADENYAHFSPPTVLGMTDHTSKPDNRSEWERYHEQAIAEMKAIVAANPNASPAPFGPLTTNAFGDHFLTDAFAAGHLVNKELVMERVRRSFYSNGSSLSSAGSGFMSKLAAACWARKPIRDVFSPLEQYEGILFGLKKLNFDTENMFHKLLVGIAEKAPSKVLNLPLKALHDHLNEVGVEVTNDAGDTPWTLKGDGHLSQSKTLAIMKRAVKQSVDNILSPEILVSEANQGPLSRSSHPVLLARVWQHVPYPTASGRTQALAALTTYTDLGSPVLLNKAAEVIEGQAPFIAQELIKRKIVQHEDGADYVWTGAKWEQRQRKAS